MRKIVLDTNVLISGIIACGPSARIVDAVQRGELLLVASADLLREFSEVVTRPHIARKYPQARPDTPKPCSIFCALTQSWWLEFLQGQWCSKIRTTIS